MVLLLWIYLIFQVFFIGCEFIFVFIYIFGSCYQKEKLFQGCVLKVFYFFKVGGDLGKSFLVLLKFQ